MERYVEWRIQRKRYMVDCASDERSGLMALERFTDAQFIRLKVIVAEATYSPSVFEMFTSFDC